MIVAFRSAKGRPFAERKATLRLGPVLGFVRTIDLDTHEVGEPADGWLTYLVAFLVDLLLAPASLSTIL